MEKLWKQADFHIEPVLKACCAIVIVLFLTILGAQQIAKSTLYRQSAFVSSIVSQDTFSLGGAANARRNLGLLQKFVSAVTDAYINFELIPVNEVNTFLVVMESLNEGIDVERFAYQRKNLIIYGTAQSQEQYERFTQSLRETGHFEAVNGHFYVSTDDDLKFELEGSAAASASYRDFVQFPASE